MQKYFETCSVCSKERCRSLGKVSVGCNVCDRELTVNTSRALFSQGPEVFFFHAGWKLDRGIMLLDETSQLLHSETEWQCIGTDDFGWSASWLG